ncbi:hypothetical protein H5410_060936, partial [Solanum commersonii]
MQHSIGTHLLFPIISSLSIHNYISGEVLTSHVLWNLHLECSIILCKLILLLTLGHFLWGLFFFMRQDIDGCVEGSSNKVIDIELDIKDGENVGRLDI